MTLSHRKQARSKPQRPYIVGLTGGICTGKTTVAEFLAQLEVPTVDADILARQVVMPESPALAQIKATFGENMIASDGTLDRKKMGALVFADPDARNRLEDILHPHIADSAEERFLELGKMGHLIVIYEASLIVECGLYHSVDMLMVVTMEPDKQREQLQRSRGMTPDEATKRLNAQYPQHAKVALADYVIDTSNSLDKTRERTKQVWDRVCIRLLGGPWEWVKSNRHGESNRHQQ